jgi:hypothetical protein
MRLCAARWSGGPPELCLDGKASSSSAPASRRRTRSKQRASKSANFADLAGGAVNVRLTAFEHRRSCSPGHCVSEKPLPFWSPSPVTASCRMRWAHGARRERERTPSRCGVGSGSDQAVVVLGRGWPGSSGADNLRGAYRAINRHHRSGRDCGTRLFNVFRHLSVVSCKLVTRPARPSPRPRPTDGATCRAISGSTPDVAWALMPRAAG